MSDHAVDPQPSYGLTTALFKNAPRNTQRIEADEEFTAEQNDNLHDDCGNLVGVRYDQADVRERVTGLPDNLETSPLSMPAHRQNHATAVVAPSARRGGTR